MVIMATTGCRDNGFFRQRRSSLDARLLGYEGRKYAWHEGYWGEKVGFYGGINYGNGYFGTGFKGGHWEGNVFQHNTAVSKVDHTTCTTPT